MNLQEHLLTCLAEECVETAQRITKALRFGLHEVQPGQALSNLDRIGLEHGDFLAVKQLLSEQGIEIRANLDHIAEKKLKVLKFAQYAREQGVLT